MATKRCKECKQELNSPSKKCPNCGKDQRNWFMRHKVLTFIGAIAFLIVISVAANGGKNNTATADNGGDKGSTATTAVSQSKAAETTETTETAETPETPETPKTTKYSDGKYLVGKEIKSGLYKVTLTDNFTKMGYVERAKDLNMEVDSIIANILLTGNGYVEIKPTDAAVKLIGVEIEPVKLEDIKPDLKKEVSDGIYLVGYDIAPGTYKIEITDTTTKMGYVQRSRSVAMDVDDIIANEIEQGPGYVKIEKGDFAVSLQGVKLTLQQ